MGSILDLGVQTITGSMRFQNMGLTQPNHPEPDPQPWLPMIKLSYVVFYFPFVCAERGRGEELSIAGIFGIFGIVQ